MLTPDFLGVEEEALQTVLAARPEVFNHNIETVRRLHARMRGAKADYDKALWLLRRAKEIADYHVLTKSGIIVGLGETNDEVVETMRDLRANGVDVVTIGQYLQPSAKHAPIDRWVHPDEFRWFREQGEELGLRLGLLRPARALELPRRRAAARGRDRPRRGRLLERERPAGAGLSVVRSAVAAQWPPVNARAGTRFCALGVPSPVTGSQPRPASKPAPPRSATSLFPTVTSLKTEW